MLFSVLSNSLFVLGWIHEWMDWKPLSARLDGLVVCVSFPLVYHYLAGLRHFVWDFTPSYLENEGVHKTSIILVGSATAISGVFLFL